MAFTFVDLFAGIGGFHAALHPLGGKCVLASEIDPDAIEIYEKNWRGRDKTFRMAGDIRTLTAGSNIRIPTHEVLTAGFPCQPFSKSGHQRGVNEARGTLFDNILAIVDARKPRLVLLENVRNLLGPKHKDDYHKMIQMLREHGYAVSDQPTILSPHSIPYEFGGTPQSRERVFIGAIYLGKSRAQKLKDLGPVIGKNPFGRTSSLVWDIQDFLMTEDEIEPAEFAKLKLNLQQKEALRAWSEFVKLHTEQRNSQLPGLPLWTDYWTDRYIHRIPRDIPEWKQRFIERNVDFYVENRRWIDSWRTRVQLEDLIPSYRKFEWQARNTLSVKKTLIQFRPSGIRVKEPTYVPAFVAMSQTPVIGWLGRELAVDEAKVLQGFPENFSFNGQKSNKSMKQIGNAVHPGVASFVFRSLVKQAKDLNQPWATELDTSKLRLKALPK